MEWYGSAKSYPGFAELSPLERRQAWWRALRIRWHRNRKPFVVFLVCSYLVVSAFSAAIWYLVEWAEMGLWGHVLIGALAAGLGWMFIVQVMVQTMKADLTSAAGEVKRTRPRFGA